ncbi:helix-turn-helix domain-containing protein [Luteimonas panaciterrae]|uniref:helix-turn-helix domain-containing protein n=1 Tax=Luteimonas panaciterrae TaxID=363885 RepID=UPI001CF96327|nr:helix-turn-helix domain-containing protein [Luteimonas panaciterrae]
MGLSSRIREARKNADLSQQALARRLGLAHWLVSKWERNSCPQPTQIQLDQIAEITGVSREWLVTGYGRMTVASSSCNVYQLFRETATPDDGEEEERRLLSAFRTKSQRVRRTIIEVIEEL